MRSWRESGTRRQQNNLGLFFLSKYVRINKQSPYLKMLCKIWKTSLQHFIIQVKNYLQSLKPFN